MARLQQGAQDVVETAVDGHGEVMLRGGGELAGDGIQAGRRAAKRRRPVPAGGVHDGPPSSNATACKLPRRTSRAHQP